MLLKKSKDKAKTKNTDGGFKIDIKEDLDNSEIHLSDKFSKLQFDCRYHFEELQKLFYLEKYDGSYTVYALIDYHFNNNKGKMFDTNIRKGFLSITVFDKQFNFDFWENKNLTSTKRLVLFCEYIVYWIFYLKKFHSNNEIIMQGLRPVTNPLIFQIEKIQRQIDYIINYLNYEEVYLDDDRDELSKEFGGLISPPIFVPKNLALDFISKNSSYEEDIVRLLNKYYSFSINEDELEHKKNSLRDIADYCEPKRNNIENCIGKKNTGRLFAMFNNCNIRHNNIDSSDEKKYNKNFPKDKEKIIVIYDYIFNYILYVVSLLNSNLTCKDIDNIDNIICYKNIS